MTESNFQQVAKWMKAVGQDVNEVPTDIDPKLIRLRLLLIVEEISEMFQDLITPKQMQSSLQLNKATIVVDLFQAIKENILHMDDSYFEINHEGVAKEITDSLYVLYGFGASLGYDMDACFAEVQRSNMSKFDDNGRPVIDANGKVLKAPNYEPANMGLVINQEPSLSVVVNQK